LGTRSNVHCADASRLGGWYITHDVHILHSESASCCVLPRLQLQAEIEMDGVNWWSSLARRSTIGNKQITLKMKIMDHMFHNHITSSDRFHEWKQSENISELKIWASNTSV